MASFGVKRQYFCLRSGTVGAVIAAHSGFTLLPPSPLRYIIRYNGFGCLCKGIRSRLHIIHTVSSSLPFFFSFLLSLFV